MKKDNLFYFLIALMTIIVFAGLLAKSMHMIGCALFICFYLIFSNFPKYIKN